MANKSQKLFVSNLSADPMEELACRIKDPLWFLARQWQTGEFQAENGGMPAHVSVTHRDAELSHITRDKRSPLDLHQPLDAAVEAEDDDGDAPGWRAAALEYEFAVESKTHHLKAREYAGRGLDWWHFDIEKTLNGRGKAITQRMVPTQLHFKGAPHPRWWRFEDGDAAFDAPVDPEPNALSTLLPEFFYTDIDNWFVFPLPIRAGSIREINEMRVVDSFGIVTKLGPADQEAGGDEGWHLFSMSDSSKPGGAADGRLYFAPHIAGDVLDNDLIEDVRFIRDEDANLVWAVEQAYRDDDGTLVQHGDKARMTGEPAKIDVPDGHDGAFRLQSETPEHWIPYVAMSVKKANGAPNGETYLRRGRTKETLAPGETQYKALIVKEAIRLNEEEIASVGIRVRRINRYARGSDAKPYHWVARSRDVTDRVGSSAGLRFDYVVKS